MDRHTTFLDLGVSKIMKNKQNIFIGILIFLIVVMLGLLWFFRSNTQVVSTKSTDKLVTPTTIKTNSQNKIVIPKEQVVKLEKDADYVGKFDESLTAQFPWIDKLPLMSDRFFVMFDSKNKKFILKIYVKEDSPLVLEEVKALLLEKGVDVNYPFEVKNVAK